MRNVILLMKYGLLLHGKAIWRVKWHFLFLFAVMAVTVLTAIHQPPKLFLITYYNEDGSYLSRLAIDNFVKEIKAVAEIREEKSLPKEPAGDAFLYFPRGFAESWQHFEQLPAQVYLLTKNPVDRILLEESFRAYEAILLGSESVILAYNQELADLKFAQEQVVKKNVEISLDFLTLALQRNRLLTNNPMETLPAALTKRYYFFSLSLFLGFLLGVFHGGAEIEKRRRYRRLFLTTISAGNYFVSQVLLVAASCVFYGGSAFVIGKYALEIDIEPDFFIGLTICLLASYLLLLLISYAFRELNGYYMLMLSALLIFGLFGGAFLPISAYPKEWIGLTLFSPFYHILLFLLRVSGSGLEAIEYGGLALLLAALLTGHLIGIRRVRYV